MKRPRKEKSEFPIYLPSRQISITLASGQPGPDVCKEACNKYPSSIAGIYSANAIIKTIFTDNYFICNIYHNVV